MALVLIPAGHRIWQASGLTSCSGVWCTRRHSLSTFSERTSALKAEYVRMVDAGVLQGGDPGQVAAVNALDSLVQLIPLAAAGRGSTSRAISNKESGFNISVTLKSVLQQLTKPSKTHALSPRGVYLHGAPGRGKTMLMDMFYQQASTDRKERIHFHKFMLDVHALLHSRTQLLKRTNQDVGDVLDLVAREILASTQVLCLDEVEVTDIADALVLRRLFEKLLADGLVLVATSNRAPSELYKGGLNYSLFSPFVKTLTSRCHVVDLDSRTQRLYTENVAKRTEIQGETQQHKNCMEGARGQGEDNRSSGLEANTKDYRAAMRDQGRPVHVIRCVPADCLEGTKGLPPSNIVQCLELLAPGGLKMCTARRIPVPPGRHLGVPLASGEIAVLHFNALCQTGVPVGVADYLALAHHFRGILLWGVPQLTRDREESARRFINLVDVLYEHEVLLVANLDSPLEDLFGSRSAEPEDGNAGHWQHASIFENRPQSEVHVSSSGGSSGWSTTMVGETEWSATGLTRASLATLAQHDADFTFRAAARTISRLQEMTSATYVAKHCMRHGIDVEELIHVTSSDIQQC